jgi:hypothetical protein
MVLVNKPEHGGDVSRLHELIKEQEELEIELSYQEQENLCLQEEIDVRKKENFRLKELNKSLKKRAREIKILRNKSCTILAVGIAAAALLICSGREEMALVVLMATLICIMVVDHCSNRKMPRRTLSNASQGSDLSFTGKLINYWKNLDSPKYPTPRPRLSTCQKAKVDDPIEPTISTQQSTTRSRLGQMSCVSSVDSAFESMGSKLDMLSNSVTLEGGCHNAALRQNNPSNVEGLYSSTENKWNDQASGLLTSDNNSVVHSNSSVYNVNTLKRSVSICDGSSRAPVSYTVRMRSNTYPSGTFGSSSVVRKPERGV